MTDKVLSLLGLARRAGKLEAGFDAVKSAIREGKACLVAAAEDISEKTFENLEYEARKAKIPAVRISANIAETGRACGVKAGVLAVTDQGFAKSLGKLIEQSTQEKEERRL